MLITVIMKTCAVTITLRITCTVIPGTAIIECAFSSLMVIIQEVRVDKFGNLFDCHSKAQFSEIVDNSIDQIGLFIVEYLKMIYKEFEALCHVRYRSTYLLSSCATVI